MIPRALLIFWLAGFGLLPAAFAEDIQTVVRGSVPQAIGRLHLPPLGDLPATNRLHLALGLPLRNPAGLATFLDQLYDPASPVYRRYLTRGQFIAQYCPTTNQYQSVIDFARRNGLAVGAPRESRLLLDVRGAASDIERAFHVTLRNYQHPTESRIFFAPDAEPSVESGLPVKSIAGLNNYGRLRPASHAAMAAGKGHTAAGSGNGGYYLGSDLRAAYLPGGGALTGSGQIVGLFEADGYYPGDIALYEKFSRLTNVPLQNVAIDGAGAAGSDNLEVALDIEMAVAMAPALAQVVVFETPNQAADWPGLIDDMAAATNILQFSSSWGYTGGSDPNPSFDSSFMEMAAQGQSFFQASGDGDAWTSTIWVPADSPYITSTGGTFLTMNGNGASYNSEKVWNSGSYTTNNLGNSSGWFANDSGYWGSGGGPSTIYSIPAWQTNISMVTNHGSTTMRNIPDVAMVSFDLQVVYNNGTTNYFAYGTSAAAPLWAGFAALINQQAASSHRFRAGFFNPTLYLLGQQTNYSTVFHDITSGNNFSSSSPSRYSAVAGYDLCTGLGTPNGTNFISAFVAALPGNPSITVQPTNVTATVGSAASFSLMATGLAAVGYFWRNNSAVMPGQTNATFTTNNVQLANSGQQFSCIVSNSFGSVTSSLATLTVAVGAAQEPLFSVSRSGNNLVISGSNGVAGGTYWLLVSTNLAQPTWKAVATNVLGASGNFTFTSTNSFARTNRQEFYLLELQ